MTRVAGGPRELALDRASPARVYDYYLGGSHNFHVDREFAHRTLQLVPWVQDLARMNRSFLWRVVRFMLAAGIDQFLDLGSGIPTVGNVHEVAQGSAPGARVIYVDREPTAYYHAQDLLRGNRHATIINEDVMDIDLVLGHPETQELLDFSRPLGLLMVAVMPFIGPGDQASRLIAGYRRRLVPGSYLAISQLTDESAPLRLRAQVASLVAHYGESAGERIFVRTRDEVGQWFDGMELVRPGVTYLPDWRPLDLEGEGDSARVVGYGGVARSR